MAQRITHYSRMVRKTYAEQLRTAVSRYNANWSLRTQEVHPEGDAIIVESVLSLSAAEEKKLSCYVDGFITGWTEARDYPSPIGQETT